MMVTYSRSPASKSAFDDALAALGKPEPADFFDAVRDDDLGKLRRLQEQGGELPMHILAAAIRRGYLPVIEYLWEKTVHPENQNWVYVGSATAYGRLEVLEFLWEKGVRMCNDNFSLAIGNGYLHVAKWLWDNGIRPHDGDDSLLSAASRGELESVQWLVEKGFPQKPFVISQAARDDHFEVVKWLWEHGYPCGDIELQMIHSRYYTREISEWIKANPRA